MISLGEPVNNHCVSYCDKEGTRPKRAQHLDALGIQSLVTHIIEIDIYFTATELVKHCSFPP